MYPKIKISLNGILENFKKINNICLAHNINLSVVTKVLSGCSEITEALVKNGAKCICESRIINLIKYKHINVEKWLIRLPMLCEISDVIKYCDVSLNSEFETILALNNEASRQNKIHKVILMYELR